MSLQAGAQPADDRAPDLDKLLQEVETMRDAREQNWQAGLQRRKQEIQAQAAVPRQAVKVYEQAIEATRFAGKDDDKKNFADWLDKRRDLHDSKLFEEAMQLHLEYLVLTLDRAAGATNKDVLTRLEQYLARLGEFRRKVAEAAAEPRPEGKNKGRAFDQKAVTEVIDVALPGSPAVKWYQVDGYLKEIKDWELNAYQYDGIVDRSILPVYREAKDARLLAYWDDRMAKRREAAERSQLEMEISRVESVILPELEWAKAQDEILVGLPNRGLNRMASILRSHASHPNFDRWSAQLKETIGKMKSSSSAAAAQSPAGPATASTSTAPATSGN